MEARDLMVPHGVIWGASYDSIVVLDMDDVHPVITHQSSDRHRTIRGDEVSGFEHVRGLALKVSHRWMLGDCMVVLSSVEYERDHHNNGDSRCSFYFIYDRIVTWSRVYRIITRLAKEGFLEDRLKSLQMLRGDFTHRMVRKESGGFLPFPFAYVPCSCPRTQRFVGGGLKVWLSDWKLACKIASG